MEDSRIYPVGDYRSPDGIWMTWFPLRNQTLYPVGDHISSVGVCIRQEVRLWTSDELWPVEM